MTQDPKTVISENESHDKKEDLAIVSNLIQSQEPQEYFSEEVAVQLFVHSNSVKQTEKKKTKREVTFNWSKSQSF